MGCVAADDNEAFDSVQSMIMRRANNAPGTHDPAAQIRSDGEPEAAEPFRVRGVAARNPASLRRPSRCRTTAIASSSASLQAGAGPGRAGMVSEPAMLRSWIARRRRRTGLQLAT